MKRQRPGAGAIEGLAELSRAVRESSLERLRLVPAGCESWRPARGAMSFADLARHLIDADDWLFSKLRDHALEPMLGEAGAAGTVTTGEYRALLDRLSEKGDARARLLERLTGEELAKRIPDARFGGEVSVWWVIVRGNLDHEIHHRGQLGTYLRLLAQERGENG